jgi:hypothetical protein
MRRITILVAAVATAAALAATISSSWADGYGHGHDTMKPSSSGHTSRALAKEVADLRFILAPYATNLDAAKQAGYSRQITPMMENMGYHFMDPTVTGFDAHRPPILVYVRRGDATQLVAAEWVFPSKPAKPPLPGASYGSFPAACHYDDGTFTQQKNEKKCAPKGPDGAAFTFWHPDLVTMHLWLWYPNPDGIFNSTNALVAPFNGG